MTRPSRGRQLLTLLACVLLVATSLASPVTASHNEIEDCGVVDELVYIYSFYYINEENCSTEAKVAAAVHEVEEEEEAQTRLDLYNSALAQQSEEETAHAVTDNYVQDVDSIAWSKAEVAVAEAYEEGKTEEQARNDARQAIARYIATKQKNLIESWNNSAAAAVALNDRAEMEGFEDRNGTVYYTEPDESVTLLKTTDYNDHHNDVNASNTTSVTLVDQNTSDVKELDVTYHAASTSTIVTKQADVTTGAIDIGSGDYIYSTGWNVPDEENYVTPDDHAVLIELDEYADRWTTLESKNSALQTEADEFVNATYSGFEDGTINSSDVISRSTIMFEYGSAENTSESIGYYDSLGAWASAGYDTANLSNTGHFEVMYQNKEYAGYLFARDVPGGSWEANTTYDAGNITGPVFLVDADGAKVDLEGEFRISAIKDQDGNDVDNVSTRTYNYKTSNTSELLEKMDVVLELQESLEDQDSAGAGPGDSSSGDIPYVPLLGVAGVVVVVVVLNKEDGR